MAHAVTPPKGTGGGGFTFEDQVAAYFLSFLLDDQPVFSEPVGIAERVAFQTRVDGWLLDDLGVGLRWQDTTRTCALSVKSNLQFTTRRAPPDFVAALWRQYLQVGTTAFVPEQDVLGIVVTPLAPQLSTRLQNLLRFAREVEPDRLPTRLAVPGFASPVERALFASFACPPDLGGPQGIGAAETGRMLARLIVLEADFGATVSQWWQVAVANCRRFLADDNAARAVDLWDRLQAIARAARPQTGMLDRPRLLARLAPAFRPGARRAAAPAVPLTPPAPDPAPPFDRQAYAQWLGWRVETLQPLIPLGVQEESLASALLQFTVNARSETAVEGERAGLLSDVIQPVPQAVVLGETGSGKTTALWQLALTADSSPGRVSSPPAPEAPIPVILDCADYGGAPLLDLIQAALAATGQDIPVAVIQTFARRGELLLLCDNAESARAGTVGELVRQLQRWAATYPACRIVVATEQPALARSLGWPTFRLQPLTVDTAEAILRALPGLTARDADLIVRAVPPETRPLVLSPLLLRLFAYIYREGERRFPLMQGPLYEAVVAQLFQRREARGSLTLSDADKMDLLTLLARWMLDQEETRVSLHQLTTLVEGWIQVPPAPFNLTALRAVDPAHIREDLLQSGVLQFTVDRQVAFIHSAFRAYFAARTLTAADLPRVVPLPTWTMGLILWASLRPRAVTDTLLPLVLAQPVLLGRIVQERRDRRAEQPQPPAEPLTYLRELAQSFRSLAQHFAGLLLANGLLPPLPWSLVVRRAGGGGYRLTWRTCGPETAVVPVILAESAALPAAQFLNEGVSCLLPAEVLARYHPSEVAYLWLLRLLYDWHEFLGGVPVSAESAAAPRGIDHPVVARIARPYALYQRLVQSLSEELQTHLPFYARQPFDLAVHVDASAGIASYTVLPVEGARAGRVLTSGLTASSATPPVLQEQADGTWRLAVGDDQRQVRLLHQVLLTHLAQSVAEHTAVQWLGRDLAALLPGYPPEPW